MRYRDFGYESGGRSPGLISKSHQPGSRRCEPGWLIKENKMTFDQVVTLVDRFGVSFTVLFGLSLAIWRVLIWVGNNIIKPMTQSHIDLVKAATEASKTNAETLQKMNETLDIKTRILASIAEKQDIDITATKANSLMIVQNGELIRQLPCIKR